MATHPPTLGRWLKRLRSQHDLTQEALAELANCSVQAIRFFESGRRRPSIEMAEHLAQILHVSEADWERFIQTARAPQPAADEAEAGGPAAASAPEPPALQQKAPLLRPANDLIGRQPEVNILTRLLINDRHRLVSVTGMGGMGKTRLALHLAHELRPYFADGAAFVPLASLTRVAEIPAAIAKALSAPLPKEPSLTGQLDVLLQGRTLLLVLDNFEHLIDGAGGAGEQEEDALALIEHLVQNFTALQLLVTTRERLRLTAEQTFELGGLSVSQRHDADGVAKDEAIMLFVQRASQVASHFVLTPANQEAIWRICSLLEGAPLAIELAAAWSHVLSPAEIADEITRDLDFLARGDRNAPNRHRSLRGLFDHSWALLSADEQRIMAWLATFRGGFTRQAAQAVTAATLPKLAQLVDKSLIRVFTQPTATGEQAPRYYVHNLLRTYLLEKLADLGEVDAAHGAHARYFADLADRIEPTLYAGDSAPGLYQLNEEHANMRGALGWTLSERHDLLLGLRLAGALGRFWHLAVHWREGREWLQKALAQPLAHAELTARASVQLGALQHALEANESAADLLARGLALWRQLENIPQTAWALFQLGSLAGSQGDYTQAEAALSESLALYRGLNDRWAMATVLNQLSANASARGDYERAGRLLDESLPIMRELQGTGGGVAVALNLLGRIVLWQGDAVRAIALFEEALAITSQRHSREGQAWALLNLGLAHLAQQNLSAAAEAFQADLAINQELGRKGGMMAALEGLAAVAAAEGDRTSAQQLLAQAAQLRTESGQPLTTYELAMHERTLAQIQAAATA